MFMQRFGASHYCWSQSRLKWTRLRQRYFLVQHTFYLIFNFPIIFYLQSKKLWICRILCFHQAIPNIFVYIFSTFYDIIFYNFSYEYLAGADDTVLLIFSQCQLISYCTFSRKLYNCKIAEFFYSHRLTPR